MTNVTDATFKEEVLDYKGLVLVDFWAIWCGPCKAIAPTIDSIAEKYNGKVKVVKLDVDRNPITTDNYGVRGIPTLLFFNNGKNVKNLVGTVDQDNIEAILDQFLE